MILKMHTDSIRLGANTLLGASVFTWLEVNATIIGSIVGILTVVYLTLIIINIFRKWLKK